MKNKKIIIISVIWIIYIFLTYYIIPYFIMPLTWLIFSITLLVILIIQSVKLIKERKKITKRRVLSLSLLIVLFYFTFQPYYINRGIEKLDWYILYSKRVDIVQKAMNNELSPISDRGLYKLPYFLPVVSNGGNKIHIERNNQAITVEFWVQRYFALEESTSLIYTNDYSKIFYYENLIKKFPEDNWKIRENWYRIVN